MRAGVLRSIKVGAASSLMLFSTIVSPLSVIHAAPGGNNGTLKVHEFGTPSGTQSNDPKVCAFNFEGFGFDPAQSGYINIDPQGGSSPVGVAAGPFSFGPADGTGYAATQYFNAPGGTAIADGTYKATLYGKDAGGAIDLTDVKASSIVFKVDCTPTPTSVAPADVTFTDVCGTINDSYSIPSTTGVIYQIAGVPVSAGTYPGSGSVTVTAIADIGFTLTGTSSWQYTFTNAACLPTPVAATAPSSLDLTCTSDGSYTIPTTTGVIYKVNGVITPAGTYPVSTPGSITITAEAAPGFVLTGQTSWIFDFHAPTNCPGGNPGGRGGGAIGVLTGTITTPPPVISPAVTTNQLVNTGSNALLSLFAGLFILGATGVVTIMGRKAPLAAGAQTAFTSSLSYELTASSQSRPSIRSLTLSLPKLLTNRKYRQKTHGSPPRST